MSMMIYPVSRSVKEHSLLLLTALLMLFQASCGSEFFYQEKKKLSGGCWTYRDTLDFRFTVNDTTNTYNLYLDFDYADTFATQNVYLKLHTLFPDGQRLSKQKSFDLFDAQGRATGQCSGHRCSMHAILQEKAFFNRAGEYAITLEQFTRQDTLPGIYGVGLSIEATGEKK